VADTKMEDVGKGVKEGRKKIKWFMADWEGSMGDGKN